jgi:hypothetical protein
MSANEKTQPTRRINLSVASGPNPPWTGQYFTCEHCGAHYQLGASDECEPKIGFPPGYFLAPACWTCEHRNTITVPTFEPEANPS